jgi:hypothetical protein
MRHSIDARSGFALPASPLLAAAFLALSPFAGAAAAVSVPAGVANAVRAIAATAVSVENASAVEDGVVLIKQPTSFPYHITRPGSYRLAGNLRVPIGASGIIVAANNVTLDLGGFAITASGGCGGSACGVGIIVGPSFATTIKNGFVSGFTSSLFDGLGISILSGSGALVENVRLAGNDTAIYTTADTIIRKCTIDSRQTGIFINGRSSLVEGNIISGAGNQGAGISVFSGGVTATGNSIENFEQGIIVYGPVYSGNGQLLYNSNLFVGFPNGGEVTNGGGVAVSMNNNLCSNGSQC